LKGGDRSRWLRKKGKQQKEKRRKERGIEARRLINDFEIFSESQLQTSTREENLFSSRFFLVVRHDAVDVVDLRAFTSGCDDTQNPGLVSAVHFAAFVRDNVS
jgi:hypothetical protein